MKSIQFIWTVATAMVVTACASDQTLEGMFSDGEINEVKITATDFDYSDATTRTSFAITSSGAEFTWAANDMVGIFPDKGNQVEFPMTAGAGTKSAAFDGGGWGLKSKSTYYAYFPFDKNNYLLDDAKTKIPVSYTGQTQNGNRSTAHLGAYDFMTAAGTSPANGSLNFQFEHLNALVQITISAPKDGAYNMLTLSADSPIFTADATIDLTAEKPVICATQLSNTFTLMLEDVSVNKDEDLVFYLMCAPTEFSDVVAYLKDADNETYKTYLISANLKAGKAYAITGETESDENIIFKDPAFKTYMLSNFDTDGNGKISITEAASITTIDCSGNSETNGGISSLEGIQYCTNLQELRDTRKCPWLRPNQTMS